MHSKEYIWPCRNYRVHKHSEESWDMPQREKKKNPYLSATL